MPNQCELDEYEQWQSLASGFSMFLLAMVYAIGQLTLEIGILG